MNKVCFAVISMIVICGLSHEASAAQSMEDSAGSLKIHAIVKSNRTNIYEGDIEDLDLNKGKIVTSLIGSSDDYSGAVVVEITQCRNGKFYQLSKRKVSGDGSAAGKVVPLEMVSCQKGLASLSYEINAEDICAPGESIEFSVQEQGSHKPSTVLGSVFPKVTISSWESYLFIDEQFKYDPQQVNQEYVGASDVYLSLVTAFAKVLNGQKTELAYSINKNGVVQNFHKEFILEDGSHSLDISQYEYGLDIGDTVTAKYSVGGFEYTNEFTVVKDYTQMVSLKDGLLVYS
ncbi:MAG: hypothetical protein ACKOX6_15315, partial [Bdellovibrio sp.]